MAQSVEHLPSMQNVANSNPARGSSFFLLRKKELSLGVVALLCLVSSLHVCVCVCVCVCVQVHSLLHDAKCLHLSLQLLQLLLLTTGLALKEHDVV